MKIQLDIEPNIMKEIAHYKIDNDLKNKSETIKKILEEYFRDKNDER